MSEMQNASAIGRLLEEISWEGARVRGYREGGRGLENVLTTEVFMLLDFLPRDRFLAPVIQAAHGAEELRGRLANEAASASFQLLPGDIRLETAEINVQPDATITTDTFAVLVEAKRIRPSAFQVEQLAREYLALLQEAGDRSPLLLLVLGSPPPVLIKGHGRMSPEDAVALHLPDLLERMGSRDDAIALVKELPARLSWITWGEIRGVVEAMLPDPHHMESSEASVFRLGSALLQAIDWHA